MSETSENSDGKSGFERQWHYLPPVPINVSPFFSWPPNPKRMIRWVLDRWFAIAENTILIIVASTMNRFAS